MVVVSVFLKKGEPDPVSAGIGDDLGFKVWIEISEDEVAG